MAVNDLSLTPEKLDAIVRRWAAGTSARVYHDTDGKLHVSIPDAVDVFTLATEVRRLRAEMRRAASALDEGDDGRAAVVLSDALRRGK